MTLHFDRCITPPEFATWLGVNRDKVLGWIRAGKLHAKNIAGPLAKRPRYVISPSAVDQFMGVDEKKEPPRTRVRRGSSQLSVPDIVSQWLSDKATCVPSG